MSFKLDTLDGRNGFALDGASPGDMAGHAIAAAGDFNGDGYSDLVLGAYRADPGGKSQAGSSYIVFGGEAQSLANLDLEKLHGKSGFRIDGRSASDNSGYSVSGAGDFNGDGLNDIIIGAPFANADGKTNSGETYIVFGTADWGSSKINLGALNGLNGFRIDGANHGDRSGWNVANAGDVNGDGLDDVIIGAHFADSPGNSNAGAAYVLYGSKSSYGASLDLTALNGRNGFRVDGIDANDFVGKQVAGAGDINGDGYGDLIIGGRGADADGKVDAGETYVVFGSGGKRAASFDLAQLNGVNGFRLDGISAGDRSGRGVSSAGDFNADGFDDLALGGWTVDPIGRKNAGETYVIYGRADSFGASMNLSQIDGSNGLRIQGAKSGDESGRPVALAGDVNGDGIDDLLIGAALAGQGAGKTFVVFGSKSGYAAALDLNHLTSSQGYVIHGAKRGDEAGRPTAGAGDINGDGHIDILVGAAYADPDGKRDAGQGYVIYGGFGKPLTRETDFGEENEPDITPNTPTIHEEQKKARPNETPIFDKSDYSKLIFGTDAIDRLVGTPQGDYIVGGAGRDKLIGGGGDDYISAGVDGASLIRGGRGKDTYEFTKGFGTVKIFDFKVGTEKIDLTGDIDFVDLKVTSQVNKGIKQTSFWTNAGDRLILHGVSEGEVGIDDFL